MDKTTLEATMDYLDETLQGLKYLQSEIPRWDYTTEEEVEAYTMVLVMLQDCKDFRKDLTNRLSLCEKE